MENDQKMYIVYKTINKINNKIFVGIHETDNPNQFDGYLGCGAWIQNPVTYNRGRKMFHKAILKYGVKAFRREVLKVFKTEQQAIKFENSIIDEEFVSDYNTYNFELNLPFINKPIYQFDLEGNLIKKWDREERDIVPLIDVINKKRIYKNSIWSLSNKVNPNDYKQPIGLINQYTKDGILLMQFKTLSDAATKLDVKKEELLQAIYKQKLLGGFYFLMSTTDIAEVVNNPHKKAAKIYRYLPTGEFDMEFKSMAQAVNGTKKSHSLAIRKALVNGVQCAGYLWSFIKADTYPEPIKPKHSAVGLFNDNGTIIKYWHSVSSCSKEYPDCLDICLGKKEGNLHFID